MTKEFELGGIEFHRSDMGVWYIRYRVDGKFVKPHSTGQRCSILQIQEWAKDPVNVATCMAKAMSRPAVKAHLSKPLNKCLLEYEDEMRGYGTPPNTVVARVMQIRAFFRKMKLTTRQAGSLNRNVIETWIRKAGYKASTKASYLSSIRGFCKWLHAHDIIAEDPSKHVRVPKDLTMEQKEKRRAQPYRREQVQKIVSRLVNRINYWKGMKRRASQRYINKSWRLGQVRNEKAIERLDRLDKKCDYWIEMTEFLIAATILSYNFGLRLSDCMTLEWKSVENPREFVVWTLKSNTRVAFPLTEEGIEERIRNNPDFDNYSPDKLERIRQELRELPKQLNMVRVFFREDPKKRHCFPRMAQRWKEGILKGTLKYEDRVIWQFTKTLTALKLHEQTFHGLRHTCAQRWRQAGIDIENIASFLGHSDTRTTRTYTLR